MLKKFLFYCVQRFFFKSAKIQRKVCIGSCMLLSKHSQPAVSCSKSTMKTPEQFEICLKLISKTPERRRSGVFVNFEQISQISHFSSHPFIFSIVEFEQINAGWVIAWLSKGPARDFWGIAGNISKIKTLNESISLGSERVT